MRPDEFPAFHILENLYMYFVLLLRMVRYKSTLAPAVRDAITSATCEWDTDNPTDCGKGKADGSLLHYTNPLPR